MIADPDLLKLILVEDFEHFVDRRVFGNQQGSVMNEILINKNGEEWKDLRAIMTPTFSPDKMRGMFRLICEKADSLVSISLKKAGSNTPVDMKDMFGRFTMDTIASCAFGMETNSLSDSKSVFTEKADVFLRYRGFTMLKIMFMTYFPKLSTLLGFKFDIPEIEFFTTVSKESMEARKKGQKRGDFLDLLMEARAADEDLSPGKRGKYAIILLHNKKKLMKELVFYSFAEIFKIFQCLGRAL